MSFRVLGLEIRRSVGRNVHGKPGAQLRQYRTVYRPTYFGFPTRGSGRVLYRSNDFFVQQRSHQQEILLIHGCSAPRLVRIRFGSQDTSPITNFHRQGQVPFPLSTEFVWVVRAFRLHKLNGVSFGSSVSNVFDRE